MYDLCTRPEQPEPTPTHSEMESREEAEALGQQQQEMRGSSEHRGISDKVVPTIDNLTTSLLGKRHHSLYANLSGFEVEGVRKNGTDYGFLVRQNSELLRALDKLEKTCNTLREENSLLKKSSAPETEEKVRRLRRKNTELAVLAKRLEERARKLQEANLRVVNSPSLLRPGSVEQYKKAFARQRARDLAQHADALLSKDKEIAALQDDCRELEAQLRTNQGSTVQSRGVEYENLLRESQKEAAVLSAKLRNEVLPLHCVNYCFLEDTSRAEQLHPDILNQQRLHQKLLETEISTRRKECEALEAEVKKKNQTCQTLENELQGFLQENKHLNLQWFNNSHKASEYEKVKSEYAQLKETLGVVTQERDLALWEKNQLQGKLENLEQVLKHMREVAERRQQLELEHEQALAILKFKQDEIKRLQRAQLFAKREHEGVVQMLESKVRDLEEKCRSQSEQFGLLSQELEKFRLQASKVDLASSSLLNNPSLSVLANGVGLTTERDCAGGTLDLVSLGEIAFWSLEGGDTLSCPEDVAAALRLGSTPHAAGFSRVERSPVTKHRELPTISVSKSSSTKSESSARLTPKSDTHLSPHKSSPTHEVDTASEVEELDIDVAPAPYMATRAAPKLHVFIARYSYNPYDGPNDNPEVELPLTAGEYIYVYGDMDDDGFYEGELMDGRRGLVPSNFVERVSDDDVMGAHHSETGDASHNPLLDSSLHSASHQHHLHMGVSASATSGPPSTLSDSASALAVPAPLTNGLDLDLEEVGVDVVPYPRKLTLIKQLAKSIIIGWDPPLVPAGWGNVWSYNVYVDQELRINVPFGAQTKAVLERLDINLKAYRVSVQSLTEKGLSDQLRCSMLVGRDVSVAPTQLHVDGITATSANLTWLPSNSNYVHIVSLNEEECELVKAGCYSLCLNNLSPSLQYTVKVEARPHRTPWELPAERREHRSAIITFNTLMAGPPDAPLDVQLEPGPSAGIALISWLPVTIDAAGTSNGVRVIGYTIYADKKKVLELRKLETPDSDEDLHERILKLPPQAVHNKQLFSIAEVTEDEDSSLEDPSFHHGKARPGPGHLHSRNSAPLHQAPRHHTHHTHIPSQHRHSRPPAKEPYVRHELLQVKPKPQPRVRYADTVDTVSYAEDQNTSLYEGPSSRRISAHPHPKLTSTSKERSLLKGLGDRLRREAMLRSQMAVAASANPNQDLTAQRTYPDSTAVRTLKSPISRGMEIDVEYGTDNEEPVECSGGEVVVEQMSSEWWEEGAQVEHCRTAHGRIAKAGPMVNMTSGQL
uniref:Peripheral-type benzodiazepine receptor-associated protein 1 n=1 Tax=Nothobranchius rachovii TaxID=451742 RepID=A0A1A8Q8Y2_9TELE